MGVSAFAIAAVVAAGAHAQTAAASSQPANDSASPNSTVKEVVVTGQRASLRSALQIKKNSEQIVDSITAVDIGALPDRSVTESLQRISGVTITRAADPRDTQRVDVEGSGIQIRGLSWVASELNGRDSFSATNGRSLSFQDIPAELMAGVDVYKNPSAELIEGGVGGTVNLRTRLPFDAPGQLLAFSADASYGDLVHTWQPSGSVLYSNRWQTPVGEFGLLLDYSNSNFEGRTDTESVDPYFARSTSTGSCVQNGVAAPVISGAPTSMNCVYVPGGFGYRSLILNEQRQGFDFAAQWRPNDRLLATFQIIRSAYSSNQNEAALGADPDSATSTWAANGTDFTYDNNGMFRSGTLASSQNGTTLPASVMDERWNTAYDTTTDYSFNLKWNATDRLKFNFDVQYIDSLHKAFDFTMFDLPTSGTVPASTINMGGNIPRFTIPVTQAQVADAAAYYWNAAMDYHQHNSATELAEVVEGEYTFDSDWLKSFRFGFRHAGQDVTTRETNYNWGAVTQSWTGHGQALLNGTVTAPPSWGSQPTPPVNLIPATMASFGNFFGGAVPMPAAFLHANPSFMKNYLKAAQAIVATENCPTSTACEWTPFYGNYGVPGTGGAMGVNYQNQDTYAEYGLLRFGHDVSILGRTVPMDGNFGLRILETDATGSGPSYFQPLTTGSYPSEVTTFLNGLSTIKGGRNYTNVLPSLNLRFKVTPEFFVRVGASKSIVRPTFQQMQPNATVSATGGITSGSNCIANPSASTPNNCVRFYTASDGNPDLKPMRANNYDVAFEYYFAKDGSLTADLFYKDIYNFISDSPQTTSISNNGVTETVNLSRPYNLGHGEVRGFEVTYQQYFSFLPGPLKGIGVQGNYTNLQSNGVRNNVADPYDSNQIAGASLKLPLEGMSRQSYNAALLYDFGPWSARLSYNWRDKYLLTSSAANLDLPAWSGDYGQLDASVFFAVTPHLKVGVQAANLTNSIYRTYVSYPQNDAGRPTAQTGNTWVDADRRISLVLRGQF
jgi:TonB-dependent receptor